MRCYSDIVCSYIIPLTYGVQQMIKQTLKILQQLLTSNVLYISESCIEIKIKLNFNFHTSLWCLKRFCEGRHKTFRDTTKKCENKNVTSFFSSPGIGTGRVKVFLTIW